MGRILKSKWFGLLNSAVVLGILAWILVRHVDPQSVSEIWRRADPAGFAVAALAMCLFIAVSCLRFYEIVRTDQRSELRFLSLYRIHMISMFLSLGFPIAALGDLARAAMLKMRFNLAVTSSIRLVVYDRIIGMLSITVVGIVTAAMQLGMAIDRTVVLAQGAVWAGGVGLVVLLVLGSMSRISVPFPLLQRVIGAVQGLGHLLRSPRFLVVQLLLSFLFVGLAGTVLWLIAASMHIAVDPLHIVVFSPIILFVNSLPIFYLGWGGREAAIIGTLSVVGGLAKPEAVALSIGFGVLAVLCSLPGGVVWLLRPSLRKAVNAEALKVAG